MGLGRISRIAKYLLIAFNVIFFLAGMAALGIGIWLYVDSEDSIDRISSTISAEYSDTSNNNNNRSVINLQDGSSSGGGGGAGRGDSVVRTCAIMLIVGGCFVFVVTLFGCFSTFREYRPALIAFTVCLVCILALMIAVGIYSAVRSSSIESRFHTSLYRAIHSFYEGDERNATTGFPRANINYFTTAINSIMLRFSCCGLENYQDFLSAMLNTSSSFNLTNKNNVNVTGPLNTGFYMNGQVPLFCCIMQQPVVRASPVPVRPDCQANPVPDVTVQSKGCYKPVVGWLKKNMAVLIGIGIGVGVLQIFGIVLSIWLCIAIGRDDYDDD